MDTLLHSLPSNLSIRQKIRDDDTVDQLHHFVTVYLLAFAGFVIGVKEFAGEPVDCWVNLSNWQHFQGHVNSYCWAHKMYTFPNKSDLSVTPYPLKAGLAGPGPDTESSGFMDDFGEINFYRWVTIIFFAQAFLFKVPALIWSECNEYSGTQIEKIVTKVTESTFEPKEKRYSNFVLLAEFLETWLKINRKPYWWHRHTSGVAIRARKILQYCMLCVGSNTGNFLSSMYLVVKFLYLLNVLIQFFILTVFLEFDFWNYGPSAISAISADHHHVHFPRIGLCHFQLRGEGHWIQCLLSINMLLEKIFIIEWFWLLLLLIATGISFISWIMRTLQTSLSVRFVRKYVSIYHEGTLKGKMVIEPFVMNYLGNDGIFILRILAVNTNEVAMSEFIDCIWNRFMENDKKDRKRASSIIVCPEKGDGTVLEMDPLDEKNIV